MNFVWLFGFLCISAGMVESQYELFPELKRFEGRRLCGKYLTKALTMVCASQYNGWPPISKKSSEYEQEEDFALDRSREEWTWPYLNRDQPTKYLSPIFDGSRSRHRLRRGAVDECCKRPCSISEMQTYCAS